jgi:hypothetical protein
MLFLCALRGELFLGAPCKPTIGLRGLDRRSRQLPKDSGLDRITGAAIDAARTARLAAPAPSRTSIR